jgi:hypothetical protein
VKASFDAEPATTVKVSVPEVIGPLAAVALAMSETLPARPPVTVIVATPATAVAEPRPVTVPVPADLLNVTLSVLSDPVRTVLPFVSWIVAVRTRVVPAVRLLVEPVRAIFAANPATMVSDWVAEVRVDGFVVAAVIVGVPAVVSRYRNEALFEPTGIVTEVIAAVSAVLRNVPPPDVLERLTVRVEPV